VAQSRPIFQNVVDLGLRDLGVTNQPRRLAGRLGKGVALMFVLTTVFVVALCVVISRTDAGASVGVALMTVWVAAMVALGVRAMRDLPLVVVRVDAEGRNQATWIVLVPSLLLVPVALLTGGPLVIPVLVLAALTAILVLRSRGHLPAALRALRELLDADEKVLGDGVGLARGGRGRRESLPAPARHSLG
jgi:hypothetical protein